MMFKRQHAFYITFDGILQPLGESQVTRIVEGLAKRGWRITILSLERDADLKDHPRVQALRETLAAQHIDWMCGRYRQGGSQAVVLNILTMLKHVLSRARITRPTLIHARSYLGAGVAWLVKQRYGIPYLFDKRGFWIDERLEEGRWFTNTAVLRVARWIERRLFQDCAALVSLAQPALDDVQAGRFGAWSTPAVVIPTCVDETRFTLGELTHITLPKDVLARLEGKLVIGYIGSLNVSYHVDTSFKLAKRVLKQNPNAHFLCLTSQVEAMRACVTTHDIDADDVTITRAHHEAMPAWLAHVDWGLLLLRSPFAKRGSMPTKLGEFFASGVRPVHHGCNEEVGAWVKRSEIGLSLDSLDEETLDHAANRIAHWRRNLPRSEDEALVRARQVTMPHFSLSSGVARYAQLYDHIVSLNAGRKVQDAS